MDDMVSRQAVINEMKDMYTAAEEWAQGAHDDDTRARAESCMATNVELKLRIEKLPSVQPQRWIPVTEALPEEKQDVLLAFKHNMVVGFWEDILNDGGQAWYANSGNGWFTGTEAVDDDGFPLAWMPLPEPYEPRESEVKK